jgi:hypothetical protein
MVEGRRRRRLDFLRQSTLHLERCLLVGPALSRGFIRHALSATALLHDMGQLMSEECLTAR